MHEVSEHNNKDMSNNTNKNNSSNTNTNPHQHANIRSRRGSSTCRQWGATRPPLPAASPIVGIGGGRFMAAASPLLDAAVQLEVGAREQCECDPCGSDGEEFDEACNHGTHCAACHVWQTGQCKDCCVYFNMGKFGHAHRSKAGRLSRAMDGDGDRGRGNKDRSGGRK